MKKLVRLFAFMTLLASLSLNVMAGGAEDLPEVGATEQELIDAGYPLVERICDAAEGYGPPSRMATDQMGDYVSIFVSGKNINKDTVKPVFYDENGKVISGSVKAVEVASGYYSGAYYRIEKLDSEAWNIENTGASDSKSYTVKLEAVGEKPILKYNYGAEEFPAYGDQNASVTIYRRDVFYTSYNEHDETLTVYFSSDVDVNTSQKPVIELGDFDYVDGDYVMDVHKKVTATKVVKGTNALTNHYEQKAVFSLDGAAYESEFGWLPGFRVTFKNNNTKANEVYDNCYSHDDIDQILGRVSFFQSAYETGYVSGYYDTVLYYPYWVGGVYKISNTSSESKYFLTDSEVEKLKGERFSYGEYTKGTGLKSEGVFSSDRQYSYCYFVKVEKPTKPAAPTVSITGEDDTSITYAWNAVSGATGYRVYVVTEGGYTTLHSETQDTTYKFNKYMLEDMLEEFSAIGYGDAEIKVCAYVEKYGMDIESDYASAIVAPEKILLSNTTYTYNGNAKKPTVTVKDTNGDKISKDYYSVSYSKNVNAGTAKVTVTFKGKYASCAKLTRTFTIKPATIDKITLSTTTYTYNGNTKKPSVTVKAGDLTAASKIKEDTDHIDITYPSGRKNAGKYTVKVKGVGNYTGTLTKTFTIKPAIIDKLTLSSTSYTYNGETRKPTVTVKDGDVTIASKITKDTSKVDITYSSGRKYVGKYTVTVKGVGNYTGTITKTFKINPKKTSITSLTAASKGFTVKWSSQKTQTTGYKIQYATNSSFDNATTVTVSLSNTSKKITGLKADKTYYVRVRTYKKVDGDYYYSSWSDVKKVKTK